MLFSQTYKQTNEQLDQSVAPKIFSIYTPLPEFYNITLITVYQTNTQTFHTEMNNVLTCHYNYFTFHVTTFNSLVNMPKYFMASQYSFLNFLKKLSQWTLQFLKSTITQNFQTLHWIEILLSPLHKYPNLHAGTSKSLKVLARIGLQWHTIHMMSLSVYNYALNNWIRKKIDGEHEAC